MLDHSGGTADYSHGLLGPLESIATQRQYAVPRPSPTPPPSNGPAAVAGRSAPNRVCHRHGRIAGLGFRPRRTRRRPVVPPRSGKWRGFEATMSPPE